MRKSVNTLLLLLFFPILAIGSWPVTGEARDDSAKRWTPSYADVADMVTLSDLVIAGRIKKLKTVRLQGSSAADPGKKYALVTARVDSLIRGERGIPPVISFLASQEQDESDASFKLRSGAKVIIFARLESKPGEVQLTSRHAVMPRTEEIEILARAIASEAAQIGAPPRILSVGDAFHIAGTVAGESETQIFMKTATGAPVSLSILHRPGQPARWGVSLGEIIDDAAAPPKKNSLLWYRLACGLPDALPASALAELDPSDARAAARDYTYVLESLGSCGRTL